jgi:hypothetical protein
MKIHSIEVPVEVLFDLRVFVVCCERCGQKSKTFNDCPGVQWVETMMSLSSWYCNCNIKSFSKFLFF